MVEDVAVVPVSTIAGVHHDDARGSRRDTPSRGHEDDRHLEAFFQLIERFKICAWIVTSRPVVGSSAIRSFGEQARAIAMTTPGAYRGELTGIGAVALDRDGCD